MKFNLQKLIENKNYPYILGLILFIIYVILMRICYRLLNKLTRRSLVYYKIKLGDKITGIKIGNYEVINSKMQFAFIKIVLKGIKFLIFGIILIFSLPGLFYFNPTTKDMVSSLFTFVSDPIKMILLNIIGIIPNFITIVIILLFVKYLLKFLRYLADEISSGSMKVNGFYPEWANPTFNLSKLFIYILTLTIVSPYLPGAGSPAFKGISIFAGILISLGSSTYIGNVIAGFILTYMRSYQVGDRIKVNEITGDVVEKTILVTRIKTPKNERVTVPNASILSGHIINYTYSARKYNIILHTNITIGYDVDWRLVHKLLVKSAQSIDGVLSTPKPFVLQKALGDFYVEYEINLYTSEEKKMQKIMSDLHANIQDNFHGEGIEIMSPHYRVHRNNEDVAIPSKYIKTENE
ncbi:mechanosensitive ion channel family protein, partial [Psychrilyobacter atlanticus]|uniref:mechanosensitive ion channel family protein n=1 Tax=Psychrilyobacter atlanticus TaxID=271091 RepID=UPI0003FB9C43